MQQENNASQMMDEVIVPPGKEADGDRKPELSCWLKTKCQSSDKPWAGNKCLQVGTSSQAGAQMGQWGCPEALAESAAAPAIGKEKL